MKKLIVLLSFAVLSLTNYVKAQASIQIAILFDTSNSMDGLIDQAKTRIWAIVNTMSSLRYQGQIPSIEIALYDYGNDNIPAANNHVRLILPFTKDLDLVSQKLFSLTTRGGEEYCGAVINSSLKELTWSTNPIALKQIYIAGNEPFNQGKIAYKEVCQNAAKMGIQVNTIYCGDYQQGVTEFWYDGAQVGKGEYSNINSNALVKHYDTPYDQKIKLYNDSLNGTYHGYGVQGQIRKQSQKDEDKNAESKSIEVLTERAAVKSKKVYNNTSWDLVDAYAADSTIITKLKEEELPVELKGKSDEEIAAFVKKQQEKRVLYQQEIANLTIERDKFITELKKTETPAEGTDFGGEIQKSVNKVAVEKGFEIEKK